MSASIPLQHSTSNSHFIPLPTTPSRSREGSNTSPGCQTGDRDRSPSIRPPPSTPSRRDNLTNTPTAPETPRRRKDNVLQRLRGINTNLPLNQSLTSIRSRLISQLSLSYTPDDWQIHLIRRILQGYDSIFCAGTGYGKSLIFEGHARKTIPGGNLVSSVAAEGVYPINLEERVLTSSIVEVKAKERSLATLIWR
jgi:hypothetical protein